MIPLMVYTDYLLPEEFVPVSDLISKAVLTDDNIITIICKNINNSPQNHYMAASSEFLNKSACDVLYLLKVALSEYPPIIVEIQKDVNETYMACAARYSALVYEKYSKHPIIIIIGVSTITSSVAIRLAPATTHPYSLEVPCLFWAKRCLLMSSITLSKIELTERLESLAVVSVFLCSQKLSIKYLDSGSDDPTMKLLYKVAITNVQQLVGGKTEEAEAIQSICDNTENQIKKIKRCMQQEDRIAIEKAMLYLDDTSDYLRRQKRKYTMGRQATLIPDTSSIKY
ncbi:hypothetical protein RO3G_05785 [Rhizopus delemar RA 99-880]|uniref:Uncharacterized protein n=1 Tax=Rhizopus delemar (strain RA 99-880 / ATCC MYA-4621 / FGSC 9543 / NRRL 43880) TaxID=246409 RepID=I1BY00_RHIO9|nr:hypothetical protein RO3G_05785 [Rhizopus delemar RA 99-880]|eukprot:EIE81080.1 hypothetical protein RO3G_05785 [Rhizopus delemar RA 99-880]